MNLKKIILIILILTYSPIHSQLLKDSNVIFKNFNSYTNVGKNSLGKLIKSGEANTKIYVSSVEINTFFSLETTLINSTEQVFKVANVSKQNIDGKLICNVETYNVQDPNKEKKIVKFIFEYIENNLIKVVFLTSNGAFEFF